MPELTFVFLPTVFSRLQHDEVKAFQFTSGGNHYHSGGPH